MNRLPDLELNPQQASLSRHDPAVNGLRPGTRGASPQPSPQRIPFGSYGIEFAFQNWNSPRILPTLLLVSPSKLKAFSVNQEASQSSSEWTGEMQNRLDALIQKEALGAISEMETLQLEQFQILHDQAALGPALIDRMNEEQQALTELVNAFERYVRTTRSR